eukprot:TRINITY_DN1580_c0_g3_i1.p1 TRINITY_DN1580_c0_g3~~TRINITY_DN1580_c0_g3_i1.p1  ORF type:complete len:555 (+),score=12.36 TRINITY_DN1580_c0_g3_i1:108-1772(+)
MAQHLVSGLFNEPSLSDQVIRLAYKARVQHATESTLCKSVAERSISLDDDRATEYLDVHVSRLLLASESDYFKTRFMTEMTDHFQSLPASIKASVSVSEDPHRVPQGLPGSRVGHLTRAGRSSSDVSSISHIAEDPFVSRGVSRESLVREPLYLEVPSAEVGLELLRFPYQLKLSGLLIEQDQVIELLLCADMYMVTRAVEECTLHLDKMTDNEYSCSSCMEALPFSLGETHKCVLKLLQKCARIVATLRYPDASKVHANLSQFVKEPVMVVIAVVCDDDFNTPNEETLVSALLAWMGQNSPWPMELEDVICRECRLGSMSTSVLMALRSKLKQSTSASLLSLAIASRSLPNGADRLASLRSGCLARGRKIFGDERPGRVLCEVVRFVVTEQVLSSAAQRCSLGIQQCKLVAQVERTVQGFGLSFCIRVQDGSLLFSIHRQLEETMLGPHDRCVVEASVRIASGRCPTFLPPELLCLDMATLAGSVMGQKDNLLVTNTVAPNGFPLGAVSNAAPANNIRSHVASSTLPSSLPVSIFSKYLTNDRLDASINVRVV